MPKMRAIQVSKPHGPFELVEREIPSPSPGTVRVKVQACGICHSDCIVKELQKVAGAKVILSTATSHDAVSAVIGGLSHEGQLIIVGVPHEPIQVSAPTLIMGNRSLRGWASGTSIDFEDTRRFCESTGV